MTKLRVTAVALLTGLVLGVLPLAVHAALRATTGPPPPAAAPAATAGAPERTFSAAGDAPGDEALDLRRVRVVTDTAANRFRVTFRTYPRLDADALGACGELAATLGDSTYVRVERDDGRLRATVTFGDIQVAIARLTREDAYAVTVGFPLGQVDYLPREPWSARSTAGPCGDRSTDLVPDRGRVLPRR